MQLCLKYIEKKPVR